MDTLSNSVCRACCQRLLRPCISSISSTSIPSIRTFSSSTSFSSVPPESRDFVDVPSSLQPDLVLPRRQKGILPTPREIFPENKPHKRDPNWIEKATQEPKPSNIPTDPSKLPLLNQHRLRAAVTRRQYLREGLSELLTRKVEYTDSVTRRGNRKQAQRARLLTQPARADEQLTAISTPPSLSPTMNRLTYSEAEEAALYERKKANLAAHEAAKAHAKQDALHNLYMNARKFITTEEQLNTVIDKEFDANKFRNSVSAGESMWHYGVPDNVSDMLSKTGAGVSAVTGSGSGTALDKLTRGSRASDEKTARDQERMKRLAEALTGGKI